MNANHHAENRKSDAGADAGIPEGRRRAGFRPRRPRRTPIYRKLNELLEEQGFDRFVEGLGEKSYAPTMGRPPLTPSLYFRSLLIGYFEGIDSECGAGWRIADSLSPRRFLSIELDEATPDHSTISRTTRLIDVETHRQVFT